MRILHLCLGCFYIDDYNYQENVLPIINKLDGHQVQIIASTETYIDNQCLGYIEPSEYLTKEGIPIIRLPYSKWLPHKAMRKIRKYPGLYEKIENFRPDVIMGHNLDAGLFCLDVIRYKKKHPEVILYSDTHTAEGNSGRNWMSLHILHRVFYRSMAQIALPYVKRFFYIGEEEKDFAIKNYGIPEDQMEFYPLGGLIYTQRERNEKRERKRKELGIKEDDILLLHAGKLEPNKKTEMLLCAMRNIVDTRLKLVIIGSIDNDYKNIIDPLMENTESVIYLGWKSSSELQEYLCACDVYVQPGKHSAIMQNALCCGAPLILYPYKSHVVHYIKNNGYLVETQDELECALNSIMQDPTQLQQMHEKSIELASNLLSYKRLAARLYE